MSRKKLTVIKNHYHGNITKPSTWEAPKWNSTQMTRKNGINEKKNIYSLAQNEQVSREYKFQDVKEHKKIKLNITKNL